MTPEKTSVKVLMVEDNAGDARLALEAFKDSSLFKHIYHVHDGVEAMAFLRKEGSYADSPLPDIILLDLNLPRKDGREVLAEIRNDELLKGIPIVVLSISGETEDIDRVHLLQADRFFTKPIDFDQFLEVVRSIEDFWLSNAALAKT